MKKQKFLSSTLAKFNSEKQQHKPNLLRIHLLPYLRSSNSIPPNDLISHLNLLNNWLTALYSCLNNSNSVDKSCYLECISRIISRYEWVLINYDLFSGSASANIKVKEIYNRYHELLINLLNYSFDILIFKKKTSYNVLIGKFFAVCFFNLNSTELSTSLLHNLNVSNISLSSFYRLFEKPDSLNSKFDVSDFLPHHLESLVIRPSLSPKYANCISNCLKMNLLPNKNSSISSTVKKINQTKTYTAVIQRSTSELFNSLLKNYVSILSTYITASHSHPSPNLLDIHDTQQFTNFVVFNVPGFAVLCARIRESIRESVWTSSHSNTNPNNNSKSSININMNTFENFKANGYSASGLNSSNGHASSSNLNGVQRLFYTIRELVYNYRDSTELRIGKSLIHIVNLILEEIVKSIELLDYSVVFALINVYHEFILNFYVDCDHIDVPISDCSGSGMNINYSHYSSKSNINWQFLVNFSLILLNFENYNVQLKILSFIFNVWNFIPTEIQDFPFNGSNPKLSEKNNHDNWFNHTQSIKTNLVAYLLRPNIWDFFFGNHQPIIRQYYIRLILWRIFGVAANHACAQISPSTPQVAANFNNEGSLVVVHGGGVGGLNVRDIIELNLARSYDSLQEFCSENGINGGNSIVGVTGKATIGKRVDFSPSSPILNKKFIIINSNDRIGYQADLDVFLQPNLEKIYKFDIFDDSVYYNHNTITPTIKSSQANPKMSNSSTNLTSMSDLTPPSFPHSEGDKKLKKNNSFVNSIENFFKILKHHKEPKETPRSKENNVNNDQSNAPSNEAQSRRKFGEKDKFYRNLKSLSLTSLSSLSTNSMLDSINKSESESDLTSFSKTTSNTTTNTTTTTTSTNTSIMSTSFTGPNNGFKPPELLKKPPIIPKPMFKFQIMADNVALEKQLNLIKHKNSLVNSKSKSHQDTINSFNFSEAEYFDETFPKCPKLPKLNYFNTTYDGKERSSNSLSSSSSSSSLKIVISRKTTLANATITGSTISATPTKFILNFGKSINEWNLLVKEFEVFYEQNLNLKNFKKINKLVPFLNSEFPNTTKILNAG